MHQKILKLFVVGIFFLSSTIVILNAAMAQSELEKLKEAVADDPALKQALKEAMENGEIDLKKLEGETSNEKELDFEVTKEMQQEILQYSEEAARKAGKSNEEITSLKSELKEVLTKEIDDPEELFKSVQETCDRHGVNIEHVEREINKEEMIAEIDANFENHLQEMGADLNILGESKVGELKEAVKAEMLREDGPRPEEMERLFREAGIEPERQEWEHSDFEALPMPETEDHAYRDFGFEGFGGPAPAEHDQGLDKDYLERMMETIQSETGRSDDYSRDHDWDPREFFSEYGRPEEHTRHGQEYEKYEVGDFLKDVGMEHPETEHAEFEKNLREQAQEAFEQAGRQALEEAQKQEGWEKLTPDQTREIFEHAGHEAEKELFREAEKEYLEHETNQQGGMEREIVEHEWAAPAPEVERSTERETAAPDREVIEREYEAPEREVMEREAEHEIEREYERPEHEYEAPEREVIEREVIEREYEVPERETIEHEYEHEMEYEHAPESQPPQG